MSRSLEERLTDVRRVLRGAASLVAARDSLVPDLVSSTGLSAEAVNLALDRHLETDATDEDLSRLIASAGDATSVHVILSANVFVGALRAIACARAASSRVVVRPSSRDPLFASALVRACNDPAISLVDSLEVGSVEEGEIHVYGRDETIARVRAAARVRVRGHGAGMGVAFVAGDLASAAVDLASDVIPFDQRGCLSPRIAFVRGDAAAFARALHAALEEQGRHVPRGTLSADELAEARRYADTIRFAGSLFAGTSHLVGVASSLVLPPPGRHVHIMPLPNAPDLSSISRSVVAVGLSPAAAEMRALAPPHARISPLGSMQRPPLDGPVDLRPF